MPTTTSRTGRPRRRRAAARSAKTLPATGTVRLHPRGFGFVDLDAPLASPGTGEPVTAAFVPPPLAAGCLDADTVAVDVTVEADGRATVAALRLTERPRRLVAGTVVAWGDGLGLRPDPSLGTRDWRLARRLGPLPVGAGVVAAIAAGRGGQWRATKIVAGPHPPDSPAWARAVAAVRCLGAPRVRLPAVFAGAAAVDVLHADVRAAARGVDPHTPARLGRRATSPARRDRRDAACFTVDDPATRDLDDAVFAAPAAGGVRVEVHIADVGAAVAAGSALDAIAAARATSVYFAGANLPMLPRVLSDDRLSLLPGEERGCLTVAFTVTTDGPTRGRVADVDVFRSRIRSAARLSYAEVDAHLRTAATLDAPPAVRIALAHAAAAADALGEARARRDTLDGLFVDPELTVAVVDGTPTAVPVADHAAAQALIERLMVAANESVAGWLAARGLPALYRTHDGLDPDGLARLEAAAGMTIAAPGRLPGAAAIQAVLDRLAATDPDAAAGFATLTAAAMRRASYRTEPDRHFGLDAHPYTHFTSPIRRYADLVVHRVVAAALDGTAPPYTPAELAALGDHLDRRAGDAARAEALERAMLWSLVLAAASSAGRAGDEDATVTAITARGAALRLGRLGVRGFLPADCFEVWEPADDGLSAAAGARSVRVGTRLRVRLADVDGPGGRLVFTTAA